MTPDYDDGDWTDEEMLALAVRAFDYADTAGPIESSPERPMNASRVCSDKIVSDCTERKETASTAAFLRRHFETTLREKAQRYTLSKVHPIIPHVYFSSASSECRDTFVHGTYYACVTLVQSVAEGLARYACEKNGITTADDFWQNIGKLRKSGFISNDVHTAFSTTHGKPRRDRDDFHHMNQDIEQDYSQLELRAMECLDALYTIESELFAFQIGEGGTIVPRHAQYWPDQGGNDVLTNIRFV